MPAPFAPEHEALRDGVRRLVEGPLAPLAEAAEAGDLPHAEALRRCSELGLFDLGDVLAEVAACEELGRLRSGGLVAFLLDTMLARDLGLTADGTTAIARGATVTVTEAGVTGEVPFLVGGVLAARCVVVDSSIAVSAKRGWTATPVSAPHALRGGALAALELRDAPAQRVHVSPSLQARAELREAAAAVGAAWQSFHDAGTYAQQREAFGRPIARFQVNRHALATIATRVTAAEALVHDTAWRFAHDTAADPAAARLYAARVAVAAADRTLQLHGGYGYTMAFDAQRAWRDARALLPTAPALRRRLTPSRLDAHDD